MSQHATITCLLLIHVACLAWLWRLAIIDTGRGRRRSATAWTLGILGAMYFIVLETAWLLDIGGVR